MKIFLIAAAVLVVGLLLVQLFLSSQFSAKILHLGNRLVSSQVATEPDTGLIPLIMREFALRNGGRVGGPSTVTMVQKAEMRLAVDQPFFQLEASQISGTKTPAFVWQARGTMGGIVPLQIVDAYVSGVGELEVRLAGSILVASAGGPETAKGEAMRFLAELPWNPDAILNADGLTWRQVSEASVEVSMETAGGQARVTMLFDQAGDIIAIEADERPRAGDTPARWIGRFSEYAKVGPYRFPRSGEVAWDLPTGEFVYWRGAILSVTP
jgi:hypothetical protein